MTYWKFWTDEPTTQNYLNFDLCNRLQESCNQLPAKRFQKKLLKSHNPSKIWLCNRLQVSCNRLPVKKFQKIFWKDTSLQTVLNRHNGPIYMCPYFENKRILKELNFQNLSKHLWPNSCKLLRILLGTSSCIIYSKREKSFCSSYKTQL